MLLWEIESSSRRLKMGKKRGKDSESIVEIIIAYTIDCPVRQQLDCWLRKRRNFVRWTKFKRFLSSTDLHFLMMMDGRDRSMVCNYLGLFLFCSTRTQTRTHHHQQIRRRSRKFQISQSNFDSLNNFQFIFPGWKNKESTNLTASGVTLSAWVLRDF